MSPRTEKKVRKNAGQTSAVPKRALLSRNALHRTSIVPPLTLPLLLLAVVGSCTRYTVRSIFADFSLMGAFRSFLNQVFIVTLTTVVFVDVVGRRLRRLERPTAKTSSMGQHSSTPLSSISGVVEKLQKTSTLEENKRERALDLGSSAEAGSVVEKLPRSYLEDGKDEITVALWREENRAAKKLHRSHEEKRELAQLLDDTRFADSGCRPILFDWCCLSCCWNVVLWV